MSNTPSKSNNWVPLKEEDLITYISPNELFALRDAATHAGKDDPLKEIIADVIVQVRTEVHAGDNRIDDDALLIPRSLHQVACYLVIEALQSRVTGIKLNPAIAHHANESRRQLRRVASGALPIEAPDFYTEDFFSIPEDLTELPSWTVPKRRRRITGNLFELGF